MFLEENPDHGLNLPETSLLAAHREHLDPKNAGCGFSLHALFERQGLLGQTLAILETA